MGRVSTEIRGDGATGPIIWAFSSLRTVKMGNFDGDQRWFKLMLMTAAGDDTTQRWKGKWRY